MHTLFIIFILIDQITKTVFSARDFFFLNLYLHPIQNHGLPFGFDLGGRWNFIILVIVYFAVGWMVIKSPVSSRVQAVGKSMFLAGAASNLADRLIYGYVRDFIDINLGFVFNFADVFIVLGLLLLVLPITSKRIEVDKTGVTGSS